MPPAARRLALVAHLSSAVGWLGGALAYLAIGIAAEASESSETVRGAWIAMDVIGWFVLVPLAIVALVTGLLMSLGTRWGLFRHYWVVISLVLTTFALVVMLLHMPDVSESADIARTASVDHLLAMGGDIVHPAIGIGVLFVVLVLNLYKPKGMTSYGRRRQANDRGARSGTPEVVAASP
jgi:hypothetical protein